MLGMARRFWDGKTPDALVALELNEIAALDADRDRAEYDLYAGCVDVGALHRHGVHIPIHKNVR